MPKNTKAGAGNTGQGQSLRAAGNPSRTHSTTGPVYAQGRVVGEVRGGVFCKTVRGSAHMLRRPPAWALDLGSLLQAEKLGARWVHITDIETGNCYRATIEQIRRYGLTFDRGHGRQIGLPLERWAVRKAGQPVAEQLSLFGGTP